MASLFKYKCPFCSRIIDTHDCRLGYSENRKKVYLDYKCTSCNEIKGFFSLEEANNCCCSNTGDSGNWTLWDKRCPTCHARMGKMYTLALSDDGTLHKDEEGYSFIDNQTGELFEVLKTEIYDSILIKFYVKNTEKQMLCGLASFDGHLLLYPRYYDIKIDEYGNLFAIVRESEWDFFEFELNIFGQPIHRYYDEKNQCVKCSVFENIDCILEVTSDVFISKKNDKYGFVKKDGNTIVNPIFEIIDTRWDREYVGHISDSERLTLFPFSFSGVFLCCFSEEKHEGFLMNKYGNKITIIDKRTLETNYKHFYNAKYLPKGVWEITIDVTEYGEYRIIVDNTGKVVDYNSIDRVVHEYDPINDTDWTGYEEMGYWGIEDEDLRKAFDDDAEALGNID